MKFVRQALTALVLSLAAVTAGFTVQTAVRPAFAASKVEVVVNDEIAVREIALAVGIYALTVLAAVLVSTALGRRFAPASTLKMGES